MKAIKYQNLKAIDKDSFRSELYTICKSLTSLDPSKLHSEYNTMSKELLDNRAPLLTKRISARNKVPWFDQATLQLKHEKRVLG